MNEFHDNLWAPWRMEYIRSLADEVKEEGCFLCRYHQSPDADVENHVIWRSEHCMVLMNRFPYTNGHLLIAPAAHKPDLPDLSDEEMNDLWRQTRDAKIMLHKLLGPHGFNIGINFGLCAGAGLPDHMHVHIVPRWNGDTNFMAVLGDVRVVPESLRSTCDQLRAIAAEAGFPKNVC